MIKWKRKIIESDSEDFENSLYTEYIIRNDAVKPKVCLILIIFQELRFDNILWIDKYSVDYKVLA